MAEEAAQARPGSPEPAPLERQNLLALRRERRAGAREVRARRGRGCPAGAARCEPASAALCSAPRRAASRSTGCWCCPGRARARRRRRSQVGAVDRGSERGPVAGPGPHSHLPHRIHHRVLGRIKYCAVIARITAARLPVHPTALDKRPSSPLKQGYHRELLENVLEDHGGEPASGLLLLYPSRVFHILEVSCMDSPCDQVTLMHLCTRVCLLDPGNYSCIPISYPIPRLKDLTNAGVGSGIPPLGFKPADKSSVLYFRMEFTLFPCSALLQDIKVLVVAHDIPTRLFPDWVVAVVTSPVTWPSRTIQSQSTAEVVAGCLTLGLKLAASIQSFEVSFSPYAVVITAWHVLFVTKDDSEDATESVPTVERELLIPAETINYLCKAEECTSPEDFLRTYLGPSQPTLDSEMVWPVPSYLST
ncbi:testis-expressed protein 47 [Amazona ochrocephala]